MQGDARIRRRGARLLRRQPHGGSDRAPVPPPAHAGPCLAVPAQRRRAPGAVASAGAHVSVLAAVGGARLRLAGRRPDETLRWRARREARWSELDAQRVLTRPPGTGPPLATAQSRAPI